MLFAVPGQVQRGLQFGEGGEGTIFEVVGHPRLLLKVYRVEPSPKKHAILRRIVDSASERGVDCVAWPQGLVSTDGQTGVLLPRVADARPIHQLFDIGDARKFFGALGWRHFVAAARDVAQACREVHAAGFVVVDISDNNVLVQQSLRATLIDCDSFVPQRAGADSITSVGTPLWLAPELAGVADKTERTPDHDNFALAQLIFLLLFQGSFPLATPPGKDPESGGEKLFAFSRRNPMRRPHTNELTLDEVSFEVADMFEAAFQPPGTVLRPTADAWVGALERMGQAMVTCAQVPTHSHLAYRLCPWCAMARVNPKSDPFAAPNPRASPAGAFPSASPPLASVAPPAFTAPPPPGPAPRPIVVPAAPAAASSWLRRHPWLVAGGVGAIIVIVFLSQQGGTPPLPPTPAPQSHDTMPSPGQVAPPRYTSPPPVARTPEPTRTEAAPAFIPAAPPQSMWQWSEVHLCGKSIVHRMNVSMPRDGFVGVWSGNWAVGAQGRSICAAFIVDNVTSDGSAEIIYHYVGSGSAEGDFRPSASVYQNSLMFIDPEGGRYSFDLYGNSLTGHFTSKSGLQLTTTFYRQ